jgi:hypothetical protein
MHSNPNIACICPRRRKSICLGFSSRPCFRPGCRSSCQWSLLPLSSKIGGPSPDSRCISRDEFSHAAVKGRKSYGELSNAETQARKSRSRAFENCVGRFPHERSGSECRAYRALSAVDLLLQRGDSFQNLVEGRRRIVEHHQRHLAVVGAEIRDAVCMGRKPQRADPRGVVARPGGLVRYEATPGGPCQRSPTHEGNRPGACLARTDHEVDLTAVIRTSAS